MGEGGGERGCGATAATQLVAATHQARLADRTAGEERGGWGKGEADQRMVTGSSVCVPGPRPPAAIAVADASSHHQPPTPPTRIPPRTYLPASTDEQVVDGSGADISGGQAQRHPVCRTGRRQ